MYNSYSSAKWQPQINGQLFDTRFPGGKTV